MVVLLISLRKQFVDKFRLAAGRIRAVGVSGLQSELSAFVSATPEAALSAPRNVVATGGIGQIVVTWFANTELDLIGYRVLRFASPTDETPLATFTTLQTSYVDSPLTVGQVLVYRVQALGEGGASRGVMAVHRARERDVAGGVEAVRQLAALVLEVAGGLERRRAACGPVAAVALLVDRGRPVGEHRDGARRCQPRAGGIAYVVWNVPHRIRWSGPREPPAGGSPMRSGGSLMLLDLDLFVQQAGQIRVPGVIHVVHLVEQRRPVAQLARGRKLRFYICCCSSFVMGRWSN